MIAVVAILALLIAFVAPSLGTLTGRKARNTAEAIAATLELARQRTVMTGVPHRLHLDLDAPSWRLEWWVSDAEESGEEAPPPVPLDLHGTAPLDLKPPRGAVRSFRPLPGRLGRDEPLDDSLSFAGVQTDHGFTDRGATTVEFSTDGTAAYTEILLDDESGHRLAIEVLPLADSVRVVDAER